MPPRCPRFETRLPRGRGLRLAPIGCWISLVLIAPIALPGILACETEGRHARPLSSIEGTWFGTLVDSSSTREIVLEIDSGGRITGVVLDGVETGDVGVTTEVERGLYEIAFESGARAVFLAEPTLRYAAFIDEGPSLLESGRAVLQRGEPRPHAPFSQAQVFGTRWAGSQIMLDENLSIAAVEDSALTIFSVGDYHGRSGGLRFLNDQTDFGNELRLVDPQSGIMQAGYAENVAPQSGLMLIMLAPDGRFAFGTGYGTGGGRHPVATRLHLWQLASE